MTCKECKFFRKQFDSEEVWYAGQCRRRAPFHFRESWEDALNGEALRFKRIWPEVELDDWCGEFLQG